jgi:hypothetical protein
VRMDPLTFREGMAPGSFPLITGESISVRWHAVERLSVGKFAISEKIGYEIGYMFPQLKPYFLKTLKKVGYKSCYEDFMELPGRCFIAIFHSNF